MKRKIKSNKITIFIILLFCFIFACSPINYSQSCLKGVSVWALKIFPVMFPFFVFCRIIVALSENKTNVMDKFFNKLYNTPNGTSQTYFLSVLSGYPMGAKLICDKFENGQINQNDAKKMMSICSVSGPMFMLGTVGVSIFCSYKSGIIILVSNILASLVNGFIYKGKHTDLNKLSTKSTQNGNIISDAVYSSLISILMVGAYIVLSFLIIEILLNFTWFWSGVEHLFSLVGITKYFDIFKAIICGILEITCGIINLNSLPISLATKTIIASSLIGFGGFCIFLQNTHFLEKLKISKKTILIQKATQSILCLITSTPLSILIL